MNGFTSHHVDLKQLIEGVVVCDERHAKWLNTLSYLENCGARKIAACEHPTLVKEEMLKHAAEEFRHALHLKRQMKKISSLTCEDYSLKFLFGKTETLNYLHKLDIYASRYLSRTGNLSKSSVKELAYLLVTYAIELRAKELYLLYEEILRKIKSPITVKSILLEEEGHLEDMQKGLKNVSSGDIYANDICRYESQLCSSWIHACSRSIHLQRPIVEVANSRNFL